MAQTPDFERLAFEAAQRALDKQERVLEELRERILASVYILMPKQSFTFAGSGAGLYEGLFAVRDDLAEVYRRLAYELDRFWDANNGVIVKLVWAYRVAAGSLAAEILALAVVLTGNLF